MLRLHKFCISINQNAAVYILSGKEAKQINTQKKNLSRERENRRMEKINPSHSQIELIRLGEQEFPDGKLAGATVTRSGLIRTGSDGQQCFEPCP